MEVVEEGGADLKKDDEESSGVTTADAVEKDVNTGNVTPSPRRFPSFKSKLIFVALLLVIIAAVVIPVTLHLTKDDDNRDKVVYEPLYNTSGLPVYSPDILRGYDTFEDFEADFIIAAQQYVNNVAGRSSGDPRYAMWWGRGGGDDVIVASI